MILANRIGRQPSRFPTDRLHQRLNQSFQGSLRVRTSSRTPILLRYEHQLVCESSSQVENELEGVFDGPHIVVREMADALSQRTRVDGSDHLAENLCRFVEDGDLRVEAGGESRARSRTDDDSRERQQIVRLDDHRMAAALLDMAALARKGDRVDITTDHAASPSG